MSARHQEALAHLLYGINEGGGFVALTGEVGTGKTTLCRRLLEQLPDNIEVAMILNPKLDSIELLASICDELFIPYSSDSHSLKNFTDLLNQTLLSSYSRGKRTVLLIDEAQNLSLEVLEQIRLLTNLETSETKLLQIILIGQPELAQLLGQPGLRQLNQRITARYHLTPLSLAETQSYILHRLEVSGGDPATFTKSAIRKIFQLSHGVPRLINIVCDRSMLGAYAIGRRNIDPAIVKTAASEVLSPVQKKHVFSQAGFWLTLMILGLFGAGLYYYGFLPLQRSTPAMVAAESIRRPELTAKINPIPIPAESEQTPIEPPIDMDTPAITFSEVIKDPAHTLESAISKILTVWNKEIPTDAELGCDYIANHGLRCLADRGNWNHLVSFNRPAILEFSVDQGEKRYAVLVGLDDGKPIFLLSKTEHKFHLEKILPAWNGYYLVLWKPPQPNALYMHPGQTSAAVHWLRQTLNEFDNKPENTRYPNYFGDNLKTRVVEFQKQHNLIEDGVAGPKTIIHLQNTLKLPGFPKLEGQL